MDYIYDYAVYDHSNDESREYSTLEEARATAKKVESKRTQSRINL